ncbi:hypothetical protein I3842_14G061400 [Carya illinoinensis]|uniref:Uncharacterized protein n=1 Tax=Carya illinoinensis TaxID=32201 RepID=A0A922D9G7_CARIL|nr:hypothetical protein I3842_14G061400 [Carya illinoinensis]
MSDGIRRWAQDCCSSIIMFRRVTSSDVPLLHLLHAFHSAHLSSSNVFDTLLLEPSSLASFSSVFISSFHQLLLSMLHF